MIRERDAIHHQVVGTVHVHRGRVFIVFEEIGRAFVIIEIVLDVAPDLECEIGRACLPDPELLHPVRNDKGDQLVVDRHASDGLPIVLEPEFVGGHLGDQVTGPVADIQVEGAADIHGGAPEIVVEVIWRTVLIVVIDPLICASQGKASCAAGVRDPCVGAESARDAKGDRLPILRDATHGRPSVVEPDVPGVELGAALHQPPSLPHVHRRRKVPVVERVGIAPGVVILDHIDRLVGQRDAAFRAVLMDGEGRSIRGGHVQGDDLHRRWQGMLATQGPLERGGIAQIRIQHPALDAGAIQIPRDPIISPDGNETGDADSASLILRGKVPNGLLPLLRLRALYGDQGAQDLRPRGLRMKRVTQARL